MTVTQRSVVGRPTPKRRSFTTWIQRTSSGVLFLAPTIAAFIVFRYYPLARGLFMSLYRWDMASPPGEFVGLGNFANALTSTHFYMLLSNTLQLFAYGILLGFWVPIAQALVLNHLRTGYYTFRFLYVLPVAVPTIAFLMTWMYIWTPNSGLANAVMGALGLPPQTWLGDPKLVKICLRVPGLLGGGMGILIYTAAIHNISPEVVEAAIMDGANAWKRTWHILLPLIMPIVRIMFVLTLTRSLLAFDGVWILTQGGPGYASTTLVMGVYQRAFVQSQYGMGSAWAVLILVLTLLFTLLRLRTMNEETM
jgi:multiple sugar transport system permease protein